ncbi:MAG TPA: PEP-CTERM sorting domain-containing protein [Pirellulales bacterium]
MLLTRVRAFQGAVILLTLAISQAANAQNLSFIVDTTGGATGLTPIANTSGNIGQYNAGSWLTVGGNLSVPVAGVGTAVGNFGPQAGDFPSGSFSTGNPGSLVSYIGGTLLANVTPTTISFPGSSNLVPGLYTGTYPEVAAAPIPLTPANGGATGTDVGEYGIATTLKVGGLVTVASVNSVLRSAVFDIQQNTGILNQALSGVVGTQTFVTNSNLASGIATGINDGAITSGSPATTSGFTTTIPATFAPSVGALGTLTTTMLDPARQIEQLMLTVPVSTALTFIISGSTPATEVLTINGQIAAHATYQVPEPGSIVMLGMGGVALASIGCRRMRRRTVAET